MKRRVLCAILVIAMAGMNLVGCNVTGSSIEMPPESISVEEQSSEDVTTDDGGQEESSDAENNSEGNSEGTSETGEPVTEPPTEPITQVPSTEPVTEEPTTETTYVGAWTLLTSEPLNPTRSGYPELDALMDALFAKIITDDMNGYQKAWACYEYLIHNIIYNRGMDANTGLYSVSDPAVTPTEVLWATDLLNTGWGCCYHFSSVYVYMLRAIGYDAHLVSGNVPKYGGGVTPHCWLYVNLGGEQYIFDPDLDMNYYTRDKGNGIENPAKDRFFCVRTDKMSYFYKPVTYHTN